MAKSVKKTIVVFLFLSLVFQLLLGTEILGNQQIFTPADTKVLGVKLDMDKNKAVKILGKPQRIKAVYEGAFGADVLYYYYQFGYIRLEPLDDDKYTISLIEINKPHYKGPRNTEVGFHVEQVLNKFPYNKKNEIKENEKELYNVGGKYENYGFITYDDKGRVEEITYCYGGEGFGGYTLSYQIKNDKVVEIIISVMNV